MFSLFWQPAPNSPANNIADDRPAYAVLLCERLMQDPASISKRSDLVDLSGSQFAKMGFGTPISTTMIHHVCSIFFVGSPPQIRWDIIRARAIAMRDLVAGRWSRPVEGSADKSVDVDVGFSPIGVMQRDRWISRLDFYRSFQQLPYVPLLADRPIFVPGIAWCRTPHPPEARYLVVGPAFNRTPFFGYKIVSHIARLHRAVWSGARHRGQIRYAPRIIPRSGAFAR